MQKYNSKIGIGIIIIVALAAGFVMYRNVMAPTAEEQQVPSTEQPQHEVTLTNLKVNQEVESPLQIDGTAPGNWFFEASFPITIVDANGKVLGSTTAHAQGDWMTSNSVQFTAKLLFQAAATKTGKIIFANDNPSGLPENQKTFEIPVTFAEPTSMQPSGTCSPNLGNCDNDPVLCLEENKNAVCN